MRAADARRAPGRAGSAGEAQISERFHLASAREDQDQHLRSLRDTLERVTQPVCVSRQKEQAQAA